MLFLWIVTCGSMLERQFQNLFPPKTIAGGTRPAGGRAARWQHSLHIASALVYSHTTHLVILHSSVPDNILMIQMSTHHIYYPLHFLQFFTGEVHHHQLPQLSSSWLYIFKLFKLTQHISSRNLQVSLTLTVCNLYFPF